MLEAGCGASPLVALAALRHCALMVATDGSPKALGLLEANVGRNARHACVHLPRCPAPRKIGPGTESLGTQQHVCRHMHPGCQLCGVHVRAGCSPMHAWGMGAHSLVVVERLRLRRLRWGHTGDCAALLDNLGRFDVILGADVVYVESAIPQLFASAAHLLRQGTEVAICTPPCLDFCAHGACRAVQAAHASAVFESS